MELVTVVGNIAVIVTIASNFAGLPICRGFLARRSTSNASVLPFVVGAACTSLWLQYGYFVGDSTIVGINAIAVFLQSCYVVCFYICTENKAATRSLVCAVACALAAESLVAFRGPDGTRLAGTLACVGSVLACAAPLASLKEVFRSGSSRSLPFPLILSSCAVTSLWLCYGLLVRDTFLQIPNLIGALLSGFQLCLFAVFPSKSILSKE